MNTIEDLLKNHKEQPSEEVWQKLNARLDAEMPVGKTSFWSRLTTTKKAVAAAVAGVLLVGGIAAGYILHNNAGTKSDNGDLASVNPSEKTEEVVVVEITDKEKVTEETVVEEVPVEKEVTTAQEKLEAVSVPVQTVTDKETTTPAKSNVKQEVVPANSMLARQLAADPVLKNLSDGSVDGTKPAHLSIPNLFTPNGDGVNDLFVIEGLEHYSSPKLVVRDKNGRQVYQQNDYKNTWDGENCPDGVYSYEFTFLYNGIENQATGKVRIIRA